MCNNCKKWDKDFIFLLRIGSHIHYWDRTIQIHYVKCGKCDQLYFDHTKKLEKFKLKLATLSEKKTFIILNLNNELNIDVSIF